MVGHDSRSHIKAQGTVLKRGAHSGGARPSPSSPDGRACQERGPEP